MVGKKEKEDDGMSEIKVVKESKYTGKFKVGDKVKVVAVTDMERDWSGYLDDVGKIGKVNKINMDSNFYNYSVRFNAGEEQFFTENALELVGESSKTTITERVNEVFKNKTNNDRPASSHYHIDNNGNDVWKFADDNLSSDRVKGFHQINAIKYVSRYNKKHDTVEKRIEDLEKAKVSIDKLIALEKNQ